MVRFITASILRVLCVFAFPMGISAGEKLDAPLAPDFRLGERPFAHLWPVVQVSLSDNANQLLSVQEWHGYSLLWDVQAKKSIGNVVKHQTSAKFLADDKKRLAYFGSGVASIRLPNGEIYHQFGVSRDDNRQMLLSKDGDIVYLISHRNTFKLSAWDIAQKNLAHEFDTGRGPDVVSDIAYNPKRGLLALGFRNATVEIWSVKPRHLVQTIEDISIDAIHRVFDFSPDGKVLVVASSHPKRRVLTGHFLIDVDTGKKLGHLPIHPKAVVFSPDSKTLLIAGNDEIAVYEVPSGKPVRQLASIEPLLSDPIKSLAISEDGRVVAASIDRHVRMWELASGKELTDGPSPLGVLQTMAFLDGGKRIATTSLDGCLRIWDPVSGEKVQELHLDTQRRKVFLGLTVSPDGKTLLSHDKNRRDLEVYDVVSGKRIDTLADENGFTLRNPFFSPDGKVIFCNDGIVYDLATKKSLPYAPIQAHWKPYALSPDNRTIATAEGMSGTPNGKPGISHGTLIRIWDYYQGRMLHAIDWPEKASNGNFIKFIAYSHDGKVLAATGGKSILHFWNSATGTHLKKVDLVKTSAEILQFSADGKWLFFNEGAVIHVMDLTSEKLIATLDGPVGGVKLFACTTDLLAAGGHDNSIRIWNLAKLKKR